MKTIKVNSLENRFNCIPGDYVIEANFTQEDMRSLFAYLTNATHNRKIVDGFEFTVDAKTGRIGALSLYGKKASSYIKEVNSLITNSYKLRTKVYCVA